MTLGKALACGAAGIALGIGGWAVLTLREIKTGLPNLDALRGPLLVALGRHGLLLPQHGRAMMAIFHNEHTNGDPSRDVGVVGSGGPTDPMTPGDLQLSGGPSVGPGQVYFKTAHELGLWDANDRDGFIAFGTDPANLWKLIDMAVVVYKSKLEATGGDVDLAIQRYNGSGAKAEQYESNALAFEAQAFDSGAA